MNDITQVHSHSLSDDDDKSQLTKKTSSQSFHECKSAENIQNEKRPTHRLHHGFSVPTSLKSMLKRKPKSSMNRTASLIVPRNERTSTSNHNETFNTVRSNHSSPFTRTLLLNEESSYASSSKGSYLLEERYQEYFETIKCPTKLLSPTDIVINYGTNNDFLHDYHEGNLFFNAILNAYYTEEYIRAQNSKMHKRIILNTILGDMYSRGCNFVLLKKNPDCESKEENQECYVIDDDVLILKRIRKALKQCDCNNVF